jgi:hypothetical protein
LFDNNNNESSSATSRAAMAANVEILQHNCQPYVHVNQSWSLLLLLRGGEEVHHHHHRLVVVAWYLEVGLIMIMWQYVHQYRRQCMRHSNVNNLWPQQRQDHGTITIHQVSGNDS